MGKKKIVPRDSRGLNTDIIIISSVRNYPSTSDFSNLIFF